MFKTKEKLSKLGIESKLFNLLNNIYFKNNSKHKFNSKTLKTFPLRPNKGALASVSELTGAVTGTLKGGGFDSSKGTYLLVDS